MRRMPLMWSVSLLVISMMTLVIAFSNIFGVELPRVLKVLLAIIDFVALPILVYTSIKSKKSDK